MHFRISILGAVGNHDWGIPSGLQYPFGHGQITTTQCYCHVVNLKVQRNYYKAVQTVLQRTRAREEDKDEGGSMDSHGDAE